MSEKAEPQSIEGMDNSGVADASSPEQPTPQNKADPHTTDPATSTGGAATAASHDAPISRSDTQPKKHHHQQKSSAVSKDTVTDASSAAQRQSASGTSLLSYPDPLEKVEPPGPECNDSPNIARPKRLPDPFSYRHFKPFHPCSNKLLAMKWDQTLRQQHLKKLSAAKPQIDNSAPKPYMHLQVKLKKLQMEEDRLALIERNNRILLEKMSHIMEMEAKDPNIHGDHDYAHSLSAGFRAREMAKIRQENIALLERLESKQPHYDHIKWIDERQRNLAYLQNIATYPQRFIDMRKEHDRHQALPEIRTRKAKAIQQGLKLQELRAVFMPEVKEAHAATAANAAYAKRVGGGKNADRAQRSVRKPKTPVAEIDRKATVRGTVNQEEPLPGIAASGEKLAQEESPVNAAPLEPAAITAT